MKESNSENHINSNSKSTNDHSQNEESSNVGLYSSHLLKLFEDELKFIYWAEIACTKSLPKMIGNATAPELIDVLTRHLAESKEHTIRVERVFESIGKMAIAKRCEAMAGLIKEAEEIMEGCEAGAMCDAEIIEVGRKVEHYEIAYYGTLCAFARTLGEKNAATLLQETLEEEKEADAKLSEIPESSINVAATGS